MRKIRVLAVIEATSITGPAKNLLEFAHSCASTDPPIDLHIATIRRPENAATDPFIEALKKAQIPYSVLMETGAADFSLLRRLNDLAESVAPDIFQTHNVKSNFLTLLSGIPKRYPWIAWHHGYTQPTFRQHLYNQLDRISLRKARRVVTVTSAFLMELKNAGVSPEKITVIGNAIKPFGEITPASRPGPPGSRVLLSVGRLSKEKDHAALIKAAAKLNDVAVWILGEGHERENLEKLARSLGVDLTLPGQVADVRPSLAAADVFVLPSLSEGSPNALIEAMAAGLPIVSTVAGGIPEIATHNQHALLIAPGDIAALAEAIGQLLDDPGRARALGAAARMHAESEFSPLTRAERIASLYRDTLKPAEG